MLGRLAVLTSLVLIFACKPSTRSMPPAMSPAIPVSAVVVGGATGADQPVESDAHEVAVGFDGTSYLVVWTQPGGASNDDIWGARLSASGEPIGSPFPISSAAGEQQTPALAFDGENWLVVFQDHRAGQYLNVYGARVRADGTVLDPDGIPIATQVDHQVHPAVAFDGTSFLVVWADHRSGREWDVYGTRVARDGTVLDGDGVAIAAAASHQINPAVAFDGTNYLVVWQDLRSGEYDVYATRVSPAGLVLDAGGIAVSTASRAQSAPAVVFDGASYVVAWQDLRGGVASDVYAARVRPDGAVVGSSGIPVATGDGGQTQPALAFDGVYTLVVWTDAAALPASVRGARLDSAGTVLDPAGFAIAEGAGSEAIAVASDRAGRAIAAYAAVDAVTGAARLRARALTDWAVLSVQKGGKGGGAVVSSPEGIDCGAACSSRFDAPTEVSLVAAPDADSVFGGWSGACAGDAACTVTIDGAKAVTATFQPLHRLTVALGSDVPGAITSDPAGIDCGPTCSSRFVEGTRVRLTAAGIPGTSVFASWTGDCGPHGLVIDPPLDAQCTPILDGAKTVTATFVRATTVTLGSSGAGAGALTLGGTTCPSGASCSVDVASGATATITATPSAGSILKSWTGCTALAGAPSVCTVAATTPRSVSARFDPSTLPLTATPTGTGAGTITGAGLACTTGSTAGCTADVESSAYTTSYTTVTITATPAVGSVFKSWTGCVPVPGAPASCAVTMNTAKSVSAKFEPSTIPLTAAAAGTGVGAVTGGGLACTTAAGPGCAAAVENPANVATYTTVTLAATPSPGNSFKSWYGCAPVAGTPDACTILVNAAKSVSAKFEPGAYPLTVATTGSGAGTVTGGGVACATGSGDGCTAPVENPTNSASYTTVTLTATPSAGSSFKSWYGCVAIAGTPNVCTITVNAAKSVSAKFEPSTFPLTVTTSGTGAGTVTGGGLACTTGSGDGCVAAIENPTSSATYATVTLSAAPIAGSVFKSWSGCAAVAGAPASCTVTMNAAKFVTARFEPSTFPLTAMTSGGGAGAVTGFGLACTTGSSEGCTAAIENPASSTSYTTVTLTAAGSPGSVFKSWSGCAAVAGAPNTCTVAVSTAKSVTARFEPSTFPLTVATSGTGAGTVTGGGVACTTGSSDGCIAAVEDPVDTPTYTTVTLTATPSAGSVFKSWTGCAAVTGTPDACTVAMSMARTVTARFEPSTIPLTVTTSGTGAGTVTGPGIACTTGSSDGCSAGIVNPANGTGYTTVTLTATADASSSFNTWIGCTPVSGSPGSCTLVVNVGKTVTASFVLR